MTMSHYYLHEGQTYPSVTTILQKCLEEPQGLKIWRENLARNGKDPDAETRRSQVVGTLAHYRCLNPIGPTTLELPLQEISECTPDILRDVELCEVMFNELLPTLNLGHPRLRETLVVNREEGYAGKFDLVAPSNGKKTLFDIKTSQRVYDTHLLQIGGYSAALKSNGTVVDQGGIIVLHYNPKNNPMLRGSVHWIGREELDKYERGFINIARRYHREHEDR